MSGMNRRHFSTSLALTAISASGLSGRAFAQSASALGKTVNVVTGQNSAEVSLTDLGGDPTGQRPSDAALANAIQSGVRRIYVPGKGRFRLKTRQVFSSPVAIRGDEGASVIIPDYGDAADGAFALHTDDVQISNVWFDGTGLPKTIAAGKHMIVSGDGIKKYRNHSFDGVRFIDCTASDGLSGLQNKTVTHGIYVQNVDNVEIKNSACRGISGAFVFVKDCNGLQIHRPDVVDSIWYPIHLDSGVNNWEIGNGTISCNDPRGVFWGGMIDSMSQVGGARNSNGHIHDIVCQGYMAYGGAIRLESTMNTTVERVEVRNWQEGSWALDKGMTAFRCTTRGAKGKGNNTPSQNIRFRDLRATAPNTTADHRGIYVDNPWVETHAPHDGLVIANCQIQSRDSGRYFTNAVIVNGVSGGVENVQISGLNATTACQPGSVSPGAISLLSATAAGAVRNVHLKDLNLTDIGPVAQPAQIGVAIGGYTDDVYFEGKCRIDGYTIGIDALANAGTNIVGWSRQQVNVRPGGRPYAMGSRRDTAL